MQQPIQKNIKKKDFQQSLLKEIKIKTIKLPPFFGFRYKNTNSGETYTNLGKILKTKKGKKK